MLQEAGVVLHLARSGRLILKASPPVPRDGTILVDENNRRACKVIESIGPVASPYLSTQPLTDRIERIMGRKLFLSELRDQPMKKRFGGPRHFRAGPSRSGVPGGRIAPAGRSQARRKTR